MDDSAPAIDSLSALDALLRERPRWLVLSGAGLSTASGIPAYRDADGQWQRPEPMRYQEFIASEAAQQRYWARAMLGWTQVARTLPNAAHHALAALERAGRIRGVISQNVDGLHQRAGSTQVIDLHGRLDTVECLDCAQQDSRERVHARFVAANGDWVQREAPLNPDGDVALETDFRDFRLVACAHCGGRLKPAVVFFGESVPPPRVEQAYQWVEQADVLIVAGSSLMVWSGYRFVVAAVRCGIPVVIITMGRTRGDADATLKLEADCGVVLPVLAAHFAA